MKLLNNLLAGGPGLPSGEEFFNKVFPNLWAFIVQFIAFIILCVVVYFVAYKPVKKFINKRKEYIANNLSEAASKNEEAAKNLAESKSSLQQTRKEAVKIINDAKQEAEHQRDVILEETKKDIAMKHAKASEDIKIEQEKALKELHDDVVDLAFEATKSILGREVNDKDNKNLVDSFVDDLMEK